MAYPNRMLMHDMTNKKIVYFEHTASLMSAPAVDDTDDILLCGVADGYVWQIENQDATDDNGAAIAWDIESKEETLQTRAHFPRWIKYDIDASDADTAYGVLVLDSVAHQTHTLSGDRSTRRRLIATGNGERAAMRAYGTGPVSIHMMESE